MIFTREHFIPKNPSEVIDRPDLNAIVFKVDNLYPVALGFYGRRQKPDFNLRFKSLEERDNYISRYFDGLAHMEKMKNERRSERSAAAKKFAESLKPGTILYDTWGYDQTQVEFYKVLEVKGNKVKIVELAEIREGEMTSWASDRVIPGAESGTPIWKTVRGCGIKIDSCVYLTLWDGKPLHRSWYA
jgi:hypothetical protein